MSKMAERTKRNIEYSVEEHKQERGKEGGKEGGREGGRKGGRGKGDGIIEVGVGYVKVKSKLCRKHC